MRLVDTHCHVDFPQFNDDRDAVLERYKAVGGQWLVAVAVDLENVPGLFALADSHPDIFCSVGVHPNHETAEEPTVDQLCRLASHPKCVAIGETGMDLFRHNLPVELQEQRFRTHIRAAVALDKPVIVHMRDADAPTMRILRDERVLNGIMHCFSSDWKTAREALDLGFSISFSGNITFKKNDELRKISKEIPEDMLLIETDAPFLAPVPRRGKRNEPAYVRHVAECIAEVRGVAPAALAEITSANACRRFGL